MKTIAYINDNPIDSWLTLQVLQSINGIDEVITATNGEQGWKTLLQYYQRKQALPGIIFIEMLMPIRMDLI